MWQFEIAANLQHTITQVRYISCLEQDARMGYKKQESSNIKERDGRLVLKLMFHYFTGFCILVEHKKAALPMRCVCFKNRPTVFST